MNSLLHPLPMKNNDFDKTRDRQTDGQTQHDNMQYEAYLVKLHSESKTIQWKK
jgi:hypothetical protein